MIVDHTGKVFTRLTVVKFNGLNKHRQPLWLCRCSCGNDVVSPSGNLVNGHTRSCGCLRSEICSAKVTTHGKRRTRTYRIWMGMHQRCRNTKVNGFDGYGGRGIQVCERWKSFATFFADMGEAPPGLSIDRIDNNGNYRPDNCRWATIEEQASNRRDNVHLTFNGKTMTQRAWARELGIKPGTLSWRLTHGWSVDRALSQSR